MIKIISPDVDTFALVSKLLSVKGVSVSAANTQLMFHIVNGVISTKVRAAILDLEAELEEF